MSEKKRLMFLIGDQGFLDRAMKEFDYDEGEHSKEEFKEGLFFVRPKVDEVDHSRKYFESCQLNLIEGYGKEHLPNYDGTRSYSTSFDVQQVFNKDKSFIGYLVGRATRGKIDSVPDDMLGLPEYMNCYEVIHCNQEYGGVATQTILELLSDTIISTSALCGCGLRTTILLKQINLLRELIKEKPEWDREDLFSELSLHLMEEQDVTEHGFSVYNSWLKHRGFIILLMIQHFGYKDEDF